MFSLFSATVFGFSDVDFDHSNGFDRMREYSVKYVDPDAEQFVEVLRDNYNKLKPSKVKSSPSPIIPKVIHQIWFGGNAIPQNYKYYLETWKKYHPNWTIKIWTEKEYFAEKFSSMDLFVKARTFAEQSDIARYEILYRYGGLYIDTDIECYTNFDDLHHKYNFYVNMESPAVNKKRVSILNAMIGSVPNHPIFKQSLENIRNNWDKIEENFEEKFSNSNSSFSRSNHNLAVLRTMHSFGDAVINYVQSKDQVIDKNMVLPCGYNIPYYFVNKWPLINRLSLWIRGKSKVNNKVIMQPETMSFHFYQKENSLLPNMSFARSLFSGAWVKGYANKVFNLRDKYYLAFSGLFDKNGPITISYKLKPTIPMVLYIENTDNIPKSELLSLKNKWQQLNSSFTIETIEITKFISRFYLLKNKGGVYVNSSFKPADLSEFQYKYDYYGLADPNKHFNSLNISTDIIAIKPNHAILNNMIDNYENIMSKKDMSFAQIKQLYLDNTYKYYQLDGKSIILPEMYFYQKR